MTASTPMTETPLEALPEETEQTLARDASISCRICRGVGYHYGWRTGTHDPIKLRCPCVDHARARAALAREVG